MKTPQDYYFISPETIVLSWRCIEGDWFQLIDYDEKYKMSKTCSNLFGSLECKCNHSTQQQKKNNVVITEMFDTLCVPMLAIVTCVRVRWSVKWFISSPVQQTFIMQSIAILKSCRQFSCHFSLTKTELQCFLQKKCIISFCGARDWCFIQICVRLHFALIW